MVKKTERLQHAALIAEILGGLAVVISVIYLALQIADNNRLLRSQSHYNALEVMQRPFEVMLESDTLADLLHECDTQPDKVSEGAWSRCVNYYFMQANGWEYIYYQHIDEAVLSEVWTGADGYWTNQARVKAGWVRFWRETALGFGEPFRSYVEERIKTNPEYRQ